MAEEKKTINLILTPECVKRLAATGRETVEHEGMTINLMWSKVPAEEVSVHHRIGLKGEGFYLVTEE